MTTEPALSPEQDAKLQALRKLLDAKRQVADDAKAWPDTIKVLSADDISRGLPIRQPNKAQKCLTGWATDTFLHGNGHASAFMAFRVAFQMTTILVHGKEHQHMGPFNDGGDYTEDQIARAFNSAAMLCGYKDGKRAA